MQFVVARITRAQGLRGEVALDVRTDDPQRRLAPGSVLVTDPPGLGPLTVAGVRTAQGRFFATFAGVSDRTAAEALRGVDLVIEADASDEEDAWYPHELAGLAAFDTAGRRLGVLEGLEHAPAHDLLVLREIDGSRTLVPFVRAIVPVVDVAGGRVILDPPGGLLVSDGAAAVADRPSPDRDAS